MSVQFGKYSFEGPPLDSKEFDGARAMLARCSPDTEGSFLDANVGMLYRPLHTTEESEREKQPFVSKSGVVVTWDGRLDNREQLIAGLGGQVSNSATDVAIVASAYGRWGRDCFRKLIGDWAMSLWDPTAHTIILARDFVGTRQLYYSIAKDHVTWSTILDPLILLAGHSFELEEEYVAGWLSFFPAPQLTPFRGVSAVPPCSFVCLSKETRQTHKYWDFDARKRIRYRTDVEYEEHFRVVFCDSVKRRLRSDSPVLAELSGGVDSSSIVCVADDILAREGGPRLDTVSYYDDSEPNWNERPFFTKIEERRGRAGCHINIGRNDHGDVACNPTQYQLTPASAGKESDAYLQFAASLIAAGNRVMLSGIGGDEVLGGVPTAVPELADLLASGRIATFARQLKAWALITRKPWIHLFRDTLHLFLSPPMSIGGSSGQGQQPFWIKADFIKRNQRAFEGYRSRVKIAGPPPSLQENLFTLESLRRQLSCLILPTEPPYEQRYPYLDRDLLEFLYAIPREQLVRPSQRRSLMRRALNGIVPDEVLNRRRKAFVSRAPMMTISSELARLGNKRELMISAFGVVDANHLADEMRKAKHGGEVVIVPLLRAFALEAWLTSLIGRKVLSGA